LQGRAFQGSLQPGRFPQGEVEHIRSEGLGGRVLNHLDWGGFLLWYLHPDVRPFIDSRTHFFMGGEGHPNPNRLIFAKYTHMLWTTPQGKAVLEQEGFDLVLMRGANAVTGERYPLVSYLARHPGWRRLPSAPEVHLFVRSGLTPDDDTGSP